jgi:predicted TIM-barrel fold metal-dependent hydrolase
VPAYSNLGYGIVDADQHWDAHLMPRNFYHRRVEKRLLERVPTWVTLDRPLDRSWGLGTEAISYDSGKLIVPLPLDEDGMVVKTFDDSQLTVEERLRDMDIDGVHAAMLFALADLNEVYRAEPELLRACIRAYNDCLVEEVSARSNHRLFTVGLLPDNDVKDAVDEMDHCMRSGHHGVLLMRWPAGAEPSADDDYFWAAAQANSVPVCIHAVNAFAGGAQGIADAMHRRRISERFPGLKIGLIEMGIGWIPYYLESSDRHWMQFRFSEGMKRWAHEELPLTTAPSESFCRLFYSSFEYDTVGVEMRHRIGVDRVMWSTDFPHGGSFWPKSRAEFDHLFGDVPADDVKSMVHDNACAFYGLDGV